MQPAVLSFFGLLSLIDAAAISSSSSELVAPTPVNNGVRPVIATRPLINTQPIAAAGTPAPVGNLNLCWMFPQYCSTTSTQVSSSTRSSSSSSSISKTTSATSSSASTTSTSITSTSSSKTSSSSTSSSSSKTSSSTIPTSSTKTSTTSATSRSSTSTTSAQPSATAGCYTDYYPSYRVMNGSSTNSGAMTPAVCVAYCADAGFEYSGTEYADECYCSHTSPTTPSTGCSMPCAGDSSKVCGGGNAINVVYTAPSTALQNSAVTNAKRGLCWPWNNDASIFNLFSPSQETWLYNWEMWSPLSGTSFSSVEYVALIHDVSRLDQIAGYYTDSWQTSKYLLGFNEPELNSLDVASAVTYWKQYFLPLRAKYGTILGAPAVTNAVATNMGIDWLNQFNAACQDTTTTPGTTRSCFDLIPLHWYGYFLSDFKNYIVNFHNTYPSYNLWITEFTFTYHDAQSVAILSRAAMAWLETQPYVTRYSMFGPMNAANMAGITTSAMVSDDLSHLTEVGLIYAGKA